MKNNYIVEKEDERESEKKFTMKMWNAELNK